MNIVTVTNAAIEIAEQAINNRPANMVEMGLYNESDVILPRVGSQDGNNADLNGIFDDYDLDF